MAAKRIALDTPFPRSTFILFPSSLEGRLGSGGGIGRHAVFRRQCLRVCGFKSRPEHHASLSELRMAQPCEERLERSMPCEVLRNAVQHGRSTGSQLKLQRSTGSQLEPNTLIQVKREFVSGVGSAISLICPAPNSLTILSTFSAASPIPLSLTWDTPEIWKPGWLPIIQVNHLTPGSFNPGSLKP